MNHTAGEVVQCIYLMRVVLLTRNAGIIAFIPVVLYAADLSTEYVLTYLTVLCLMGLVVAGILVDHQTKLGSPSVPF